MPLRSLSNNACMYASLVLALPSNANNAPDQAKESNDNHRQFNDIRTIFNLPKDAEPKKSLLAAIELNAAIMQCHKRLDELASREAVLQAIIQQNEEAIHVAQEHQRTPLDTTEIEDDKRLVEETQNQLQNIQEELREAQQAYE